MEETTRNLDEQLLDEIKLLKDHIDSLIGKRNEKLNEEIKTLKDELNTLVEKLNSEDLSSENFEAFVEKYASNHLVTNDKLTKNLDSLESKFVAYAAKHESQASGEELGLMAEMAKVKNELKGYRILLFLMFGLVIGYLIFQFFS